MTREELAAHYVELMGSDNEEKGFYEQLAYMSKDEIISAIVNIAHYYQDQYNS